MTINRRRHEYVKRPTKDRYWASADSHAVNWFIDKGTLRSQTERRRAHRVLPWKSAGLLQD